MELEEINQYPHRITKVDIKNENTVQSMYQVIVAKITLKDKFKPQDNEIIRFSKEREGVNFLEHNSSENNYYLEIPSNEPVTTVYAHYFMKDLYEYVEPDGKYLYKYNLEELYNDIQSERNGTEADVHFDAQGYKEYLTDDKKIKIQSVLDNSVEPNQHKDPNYKQYITIDNNTFNQTEKGYFPLVSRYRPTRNLSAPNVNHTAFGQWTENSDTLPYWEVHIDKKKFNNFIKNEDTDDAQFPIHVNLNYQYLDTSTDYHEHFYGFEKNSTTDPKDFNVFDSTNIIDINQEFGVTNFDYKLVQAGDIVNSDYAMEYPHKKIIPIDLENNITEENCSWIKNICEDYYIYKPISTNNYIDIPISLEKNTEYTFKYYIWLPYETVKTDEDCYIEIRYIDEHNNEKTFEKIPMIFIQQDNYLRHEWVYHEFSFITKSTINTIHIKGPQKKDNVIFFTHITLEEKVPHTPTIKYTTKDTHLAEDSKLISMSNEKYRSITTRNIDNATNKWKQRNTLPIPHENVYINFGDDFDMVYDKYTTALSWYEPPNSPVSIEPFDKYSFKDTDEHGRPAIYLYWSNNNVNNTSLLLEGTDNSKGLFIERNNSKMFTYGINNTINLIITDENNQPIDGGEVKCAISERNYDDAPLTDITKEYLFLGTRKPDEQGNVTFNRLDFRHLQRGRQYWLRIDYINKCYNKITRQYRLIHLEEPDINIDIDIYSDNGRSELNTSSYIIETGEEFPIQINATIKDQANAPQQGYCELYINDTLIESCLIDDQGIADFYLNHQDIQDESTIKIEYYNNEGELIDYKYFDIETVPGYDKPVIPIRLNIVENDKLTQLSNTYTIGKYGCLLIDIDTEDEVDFSVRVLKDGEIIFIENIVQKQNVSLIIGDDGEGDSTNSHTYTIITDNIKYDVTADTLIDADNTYRPYSKTFTINYIK